MGLVAHLVPPEKLAKLTDRQHQVLVDNIENEVTKQIGRASCRERV